MSDISQDESTEEIAAWEEKIQHQVQEARQWQHYRRNLKITQKTQIPLGFHKAYDFDKNRFIIVDLAGQASMGTRKGQSTMPNTARSAAGEGRLSGDCFQEGMCGICCD